MSLYATNSLPQFVTALLEELATIEHPLQEGSPSPSPDANWLTRETKEGTILSHLSGEALSRAKSLLLTLHCLFPSELLLALDIIDKRLLTRVIVSEEVVSNDAGRDSNARSFGYSETNEMNHVEEIYYAQSTSLKRGIGKSYEIRLHAWNCTCPAFVLNAFSNVGHPVSYSTDTIHKDTKERTRFFDPKALHFGGTLARQFGTANQAVCKHMLACVLSVRCPSLFQNGIRETRVVSPVELAGLCGG